MSKQYPGGIISKTAPVPSGPFENSTAPGIWTLEQQAYWQKLGQWPIPGNTQNFIEDVFSTYLVTPTTSNTTYSVTNGIDVSGKGGMVWMKARSAGSTNNLVYDTNRGASAGANNALITNSSAAQQTANFDYITGSSTGFTVNYSTGGGQLTNNGINYASWTFRKQPKFFDVVTWTGDSTAGRQIPHNLGAVPGCIIVKATNSSGESWNVYHRSLGNNALMLLNATDAKFQPNSNWNNTDPTSTVFTVSGGGGVNYSGYTYVAYLFAHDAGGFGLTGTDNVISCGSFVTNASGGASVTLGYEPQWILMRRSDDISNWQIIDTMRGWSQTAGMRLQANTSSAEVDGWLTYLPPTATGFNMVNGATGPSETWIYIAIRRGPMKPPTTGTSVFAPTLATFSGTTVTNTGFVVDMVINKTGVATGDNNFVLDRLRGSNNGAGQTTLPSTSSTSPEVASGGRAALTGSVTIQNGFLEQDTTANNIVWAFGRAPSFFDEVCYTGDGAAGQAINHNLAAVPQLLILKKRNAAWDWRVYSEATGNSAVMYLNDPAASGASSGWNNQTPTSTQFFLNGYNTSGDTYVAYLFATCAGVSKVGSYTGTGTTLQVDCGFTGGSRFVLIKRTDSTGDWYVWDSARGIVAGNDPYLLLNSTAAQVTGTDYVDTYSAGFEITSTAPAAINANGGTFIFLAIA